MQHSSCAGRGSVRMLGMPDVLIMVWQTLQAGCVDPVEVRAEHWRTNSLLLSGDVCDVDAGTSSHNAQQPATTAAAAAGQPAAARAAAAPAAVSKLQATRREAGEPHSVQQLSSATPYLLCFSVVLGSQVVVKSIGTTGLRLCGACGLTACTFGVFLPFALFFS